MSVTAPNPFASVMATRGSEVAQPSFAAYVASRKPKKKKPLTELQRLLAMLPGAGAYGPVLSDAQIRARAQADAMGILGPLLDREKSDYAARVAQGSEAVKGYTGFFADRLGQAAGTVRDAYARQQGVTANLGDALSTAQGAANAPGVSSLAEALRGMNAPNAQGTVDLQQALSAGGARLTKTLSATELQRLANEGTAQESFAALQPGIGVLQGGQALREYLGSVANQNAGNIADINAQAPSLAQSLFQSYYGGNEARRQAGAAAKAARANLAASWMGSEADRKQNAEIFAITAAQKQQALNTEYLIKTQAAQTAAEKAAVDRWYKQQSILIKQQTADATTRNAATAAANAAKSSGAKPVTWQQKVDDARKAAAGQKDVGSFGQTTRPPWQKALNNLTIYLRNKYPELTPEKVRQLALAGLYAAGYSPTPSKPSTSKPTKPSKPETRNPED